MKAPSISDAAEVCRTGGLIVLPTDTVYGIAASPTVEGATARLFEAKQRPAHLELPVLGASISQLREVAVFDRRADALASRFWPGPLTLILRRAPGSRSWDLGGDGLTIGVRVPKDALALELLVVTGPLAVTSANVSGTPTATTQAELEAVFGEQVQAYLCHEAPLGGLASTVLDLSGDEPCLLRQGALSMEELSAFIS